MVQCLCCGKSTSNPKFCSRSCSAKTNNAVPKRKKKLNLCTECGTEVTGRARKCGNCKPAKYRDITLGEAVYAMHHPSSAAALVRTRARRVAKSLGWSKCQHCGYSKHVEIAHIQSISSFDLATPLSVINHPSNLKALCPNCHWEYDHISVAW